MNNNSLAMTICLWAINYILLSSILISLIWCGCRVLRLKSYAIQDQLWKFAIIAPVFCSLIMVRWQTTTTAWNLAEFIDEKETDSKLLNKTVVPEQAVADPEFVFSIEEVPQKEISIEHDDDLHSNELMQAIVPFVDGGSVSPQPLREDNIDFDSFITESDQSVVQSESVEPILISPDQEVSVLSDPLPETTPLESVTTSSDAVNSSVSAMSRSPWQLIAGMIGCFVLIGGVKSLFGIVILSRRLRKLDVMTSGALKETLDLLLQRANVSISVLLIRGASNIEPAAIGFWRRSILVPDDIESRLSKDEIEALLAHELAHLTRHDPLWMHFMRLIRNCFFWQPLNFLAYRQWRRCAEYSCDSFAIANGVNHLSLARCLTRAASWKVSPQSSIRFGSTMGVGGSESSLSKRVERLVSATNLNDQWTTGWRKHFRLLFLILVLPIILLSFPRLCWTSEDSEVSVNEAPSILSDPELESLPQIVPRIPSSSVIEPQELLPQTRDDLPDSLTLEINQLTSDLNYALQLLGQQEDDPEVIAAIDAIQIRIQQLETNAAKLGEFPDLPDSGLSVSGFTQPETILNITPSIKPNGETE